MKELSIEEKAKHYDEALERAKKVNKGEDVDIESGTSLCEYIFPELKESEGDRIKREIIDFIFCKTDTYELREKSNSWIAWLEKQSEHKIIDKVEPIVVKDFNSVFSKKQVEEIDKRIEESQKLYNAKLRDAMLKVTDFPMTD